MRNREKRDSTIHSLVEPDLEEVPLEEEYSIQRNLGEGHFAQILLARHRQTGTQVVLKMVHKELTHAKDFCRELHYNYHLSPHPNILSSYWVSFVAHNSYTFALEYAPYGDLAGHVKAGGLSEELCKKVMGQLTSALEFMHSKDLVHRDVKLENVLVFDQQMERVKLCDFGCTRKDGCLVSRTKGMWVSFLPPEVVQVLENEKYHCQTSNDTWQLGILLFTCITGATPWQKADEMLDQQYKSFSRWRTRRAIKMPANFKKFSIRLLRLFRRLFESDPDKRPPVTEITKYLKDSWLVSKLQTSTSAPVLVSRNDSLSRSVSRSKRNSSQRECQHNVKIDQLDVSKRVWEWISRCEGYNDAIEGI